MATKKKTEADSVEEKTEARSTKKTKEKVDFVELEVHPAYKKCRSFLFFGAEVLIKEGKVSVSPELGEYLKKEGYVK